MTTACCRHARLVVVAAAIIFYADAVVQRVLENYGGEQLSRTCLLQLLLWPWSTAACGDAGCSGNECWETSNLPAPFLATLRALPPIPKRVHVSWRSSALPRPSLFSRVTILALFDRNPGWSVTVYNDSQLDAYLREALPKYSPTAYDQLSTRSPTEKVDLWRLVIMYEEGGVYTDYDRWALTPLSEAIPARARLLLPTYRDDNPSQDFMASAPRNPLFLRAIRLNIARRALGWTSIYALGPDTYRDAVAEVLLGAHVTPASVAPASYGARTLRAAVARVADGVVATSRESPPCLTATSRVTGLACALLWPLWRRSKKAEYARSGVRHWTQSASPQPATSQPAAAQPSSDRAAVREPRWRWSDLSKGHVVEDPAKACAQAWPTTRLFWLVALARAADRAVLPLACGASAAFREEAYLPVPRGGALLFVRSRHLVRWVEAVLPAIGNATPFVLATGDPEWTDYTLPQGVLSPALVRRILAHPSLRGWWATNANHPRVHRLPLGIDFHSSALSGRVQPDLKVQHLLRPRSLYSPQEMPDAQEEKLLAVSRALPAPHDRPRHLAWADFHFERRNSARRAIFHRVKGEPWLVVPQRRVRRAELWEQKGRYLFDLSPPGHGPDCFRTWESLALGMIVIVERGPLGVSVDGDGGLYAGLPVVQVANMSTDVNATALRAWAAAHATRDGGKGPRASAVPDRLKLSHWVRAMRRAARGAS